MERMTQIRARALLLIFILVAGFFAFKMYDLQIIQTGGKTDNTTTFTTRTRVKAARGDILDSNGNLLVGNRASYDLMLNHYVLLSAQGTNDYIYNLIKRCEEKEIQFTDHFPISKERPFVYTLDQYNSTWQGYFQDFLNYMGGLDSDITAPLLMEKLRAKFKLPEQWSDEEARQAIGVWYEMTLRKCVMSLSNYVFLEDASDEALSAIMELNVPGMTVEPSTVREYSTVYAAHVLGYVGAMSPAQWEHYKNIDGYKMDAEVGQDGLEAVYEEYLHGVDGLREDVVAVDGTLISSRFIEEPKAGSNVEISIDINLQRAAEEGMKQVAAKLNTAGGDGSDVGGGSVVAIDVKTGQVLVCSSYPTFDLSKYFEEYDENSQNPLAPLYNRALQATYPPGSTYKMNMVVAGINSGTITSTTKVDTKGKYTKYSPFEVSCLYWSDTGLYHGNIDATVALQKSCNYFFYDLGDRLGINVIDSTAKGLGLGEYTGVELYEEKGYRANEETKDMLYGEDNNGWYYADRLMNAIGQSDNRFTPIQLCVYTATLANQGTRYKATFMNRVVSSDYSQLLKENVPSVLSHMDISEDAYRAYSQGMYMAAHSYGGTAYSTFKNYPVNVAAKTGTAETNPNESDNAVFVCYAPLEDPQIAIAIYLEKGGHGSSLATIAKDILDVYFDVGPAGDVDSFENAVS